MKGLSILGAILLILMVFLAIGIILDPLARADSISERKPHCRRIAYASVHVSHLGNVYLYAEDELKNSFSLYLNVPAASLVGDEEMSLKVELDRSIANTCVVVNGKNATVFVRTLTGKAKWEEILDKALSDTIPHLADVRDKK